MLKEGGSVLITDGVGSGKTLLACCKANQLIESRKGCYFINVGRYLASKFAYAVDDDKVIGVKMQILNDLDTEKLQNMRPSVCYF